MFEKSIIFCYCGNFYGNLTILEDLLQAEKAKLPYPWDKFNPNPGSLGHI
jgi:hypothetical protein